MKQNYERINRFSIRKLSIGAVSCMIGAFWLASGNIEQVKADTIESIEANEAVNSSKEQTAQTQKEDNIVAVNHVQKPASTVEQTNTKTGTPAVSTPQKVKIRQIIMKHKIHHQPLLRFRLKHKLLKEAWTIN